MQFIMNESLKGA